MTTDPEFTALCDEFQGWTVKQGLPEEGDAMDLLYHPSLTDTQRQWLTDFIMRWDAMEERSRNA